MLKSKSIIENIAATMQTSHDCSQCALRNSCDRTPLENAWREQNKRCSLWRMWNG
jgi:hypothetical protein